MPNTHDAVFNDFQRNILKFASDNIKMSIARSAAIVFFQMSQIFDLLTKNAISVADRRVIDLGCGAIRPYSNSILFYLLGAKSCMAVDLEAPHDISANHIADLCMILNVASGDYGKYPFDGDLNNVRARCADFNIVKMLLGEEGCLPSSITHRTARYQELPDNEKKFDLMISNSVFEHIDDIREFLSSARKNISKNGLVYASIDFRDHRLYTDGASAWQYLIDDSDYLDGYINKIRFREMLGIIEKSGFEIVDYVAPLTTGAPVSSFRKKYQNIGEVDINTLETQVIFRAK